MTRLLVSVRSAAEAEVACTAGADLIDVKEPARGSLGAADAAVVEAVLAAVGGRLPVSAALGELVEGAPLAESLNGGVQYAKFGLAGCRDLSAWVTLWQAAIARLPLAVVPVAVAYADWQVAAAPPPNEVLEQAVRVGCGAILLDTYDKSQGPLTKCIHTQQLRAFVREASERNLVSVVAGGLDANAIAEVLPLAPDYVAVRGAACARDRTGALEGARVRRLAALVHASARLAAQAETDQ